MDVLNQISQGIDSFFSSHAPLSKQQHDIIAIATIVIGVLFCFFGYRFIKYLLFATGFFSGALIGLSLFYYLPYVNTTGEIGQLSTAAVTGLLAALLFYFLLYHFSIFVFGAVGAMWLALVLLPRTGQIGEIRLILVLAAGLLGGLMGFIVRKLVFVTITALLGATLIIFGIGHFNYWPTSTSYFSMTNTFSGQFIETIYYHNDGMIIIAIFAAAAVVGFCVQFFTGGKKKEQPAN